VKEAAQQVLRKLAQAAISDRGSPFHGKKEEEIEVAHGRIFLKGSRPETGLTYGQVLASKKETAVEAESFVTPGEEQNKHSFQSFGAQFVEVQVDPEIAKVIVSRVVSAFDVGRIINAKTAQSQAYSGIVMGIGMALMEQTVYDDRDGSIITSNLADYAVPVNADIRSMEVHFIDQPDPFMDSMGIGARGVGEITITGVAPAIANAVYHATGIRVRDLPITPDKLLNLS
jgi:xanthine dehydrogenase YagR molybdenum-binding subunit